MEQAYAQALKELIDSGKSPKQAVALIKNTLEARGRGGLLPRVGHAFARLMAREERKNGITLFIAETRDEKKAQKEASAFIPKDQEVSVQIDDSLIGGWRLEGGGQVVDMSFKKQLLSLYNHATN